MAEDADLRITLPADRKADAANSFARSGILRIGDLFVGNVAGRSVPVRGL